MDKMLMSHGIDFESKTIELTGEVNQFMFSKIHRALMHFDNIKDHRQLKIVLNTEGGDFYQALAIYDMVKRLDEINPVKIVCIGAVMSSGAIILQAASERVMFQNAHIMVHFGEEVAETSTQQTHNREMLKKMKKIIGDRSSVGTRTIHNWFTKDTYFNADHALKVGLVDRIAYV